MSNKKRIPLQYAFMNFAKDIAKRSTCSRLQVGSVVASADLTQVYSFGFNGVAKGLPNGCLRGTPGDCGCLHAEENALIKLLVHGPAVMFVTTAPCERCQMRILNSSIKLVYFDIEYRTPISNWFTTPIFQISKLSTGALELHLKQLRRSEYDNCH